MRGDQVYRQARRDTPRPAAALHHVGARGEALVERRHFLLRIKPRLLHARRIDDQDAIVNRNGRLGDISGNHDLLRRRAA